MEYVFKEDGKLYLVRCPKCEKENYLPAVASGQCCWCEYIAGDNDIKMEKDNVNS